MAEQFLYLSTMGRKSRQWRTIEIWYVEHAGNYYVVSERREESQWVKNLRIDAGVEISIGTRADRDAALARAAARARVVAESETALALAVRAAMDEKYHWSDGLIVELSPRS